MNSHLQIVALVLTCNESRKICFKLTVESGKNKTTPTTTPTPITGSYFDSDSDSSKTYSFNFQNFFYSFNVRKI